MKRACIECEELRPIEKFYYSGTYGWICCYCADSREIYLKEIQERGCDNCDYTGELLISVSDGVSETHNVLCHGCALA